MGKEHLLRKEWKMNKKYLVIAGCMVLMAALVTVSVYGEKESRSKKAKLPEAVAAAVQAQFPQGVIEEVETDSEGIMLYEVEVEDGATDYELSVAPDGTIVEQEEEIAFEGLPEAVKAAIGEGAEIGEVTKEVSYYVVTLKKLDTPKVSYEVAMKQGGHAMEIEFAADGTVLAKEKIQPHDDDDDDDNGKSGDDDDDDSDDAEGDD